MSPGTTWGEVVPGKVNLSAEALRQEGQGSCWGDWGEGEA